MQSNENDHPRRRADDQPLDQPNVERVAAMMRELFNQQKDILNRLDTHEVRIRHLETGENRYAVTL